MKKRLFRGAFGILYTLAAAAVVVATAVIAAVVGAHQRIVATAAEQNQQNDDPAQIATAEAIVTHRRYLQEVVAAFTAHSKIFRSEKNVRLDGGGLPSLTGETPKDRNHYRGATLKIPPTTEVTGGIWEAWITCAASSAANPCRLRSGKRCRRPHSRQRH